MNKIMLVLNKSAELLKDNPEEKRRLILETCFGERVYTRNFTFAEIRNWLNQHKDLLTKGSRAMIFKLDDEKFDEMFGEKFSDVSLDDEQYIVAMIMTAKKSDIAASILVQYESLDPKFEAMLGSEGTLVIEGVMLCSGLYL